MLRGILIAFALVVASSAAKADTTIIPQSSLSPSQGLYTTDFGTPMAAGDDRSFAVDLDFDFTFFGSVYGSLFVNNNGNLTFGRALGDYIPEGLTGAFQPIISAFFGDVDTRGIDSGVVHVNSDLPGQLVVTWDRVGYFDEGSDLLNTFQIVLRADDYLVPAGEGVIGFFYGVMQWEETETSTTAAVGTGDGLGQVVALEGSNEPGLNAVLENKHLWLDRSVVAVPGPIAGAGLPVAILAVIGLWRRRQRTAAA